MNTLQGKDDSENKFKTHMKKIILLLAIFLLPVLTSAQSTQDNQPIEKKAVYFYSETCPHCERVNQYFQDNGIYDKYEIQKIETSGQYNLEYLNKFFDAFNVPAEKRGYPVVFFDDKMIFGDQPIIDSFVKEIEQVNASELSTPDLIKANLDAKNAAIANANKIGNNSIPIPILMLAALTDASNPCALAVLILLLATVIASKGKRQALLSGLLFSLAIFLSYFLMGIGVYKAITAFSIPKYLSLFIGVLSIVIGLANLKDVFWYGKYFIMEVPMSWRPKMQSILKKVSNPIGAFGVGFVVSLFLVPCASGPYVVILGLLAQKVNTAKTLPLLILYNFIFVLPMLVITFAMYFGSRMGKIEKWRQANLRVLHLIAGGIMLFIGGYLIYTWI